MKKTIFIFFLILITSLLGYLFIQLIDFKYYWEWLQMDHQIEILFDWCVYVLIEAAKYTNTTYELVNIVLFVLLMPLVILVQMLINITLIYRVRKLQKA
jgi:hypothetical protein